MGPRSPWFTGARTAPGTQWDIRRELHASKICGHVTGSHGISIMCVRLAGTSEGGGEVGQRSMSESEQKSERSNSTAGAHQATIPSHKQASQTSSRIVTNARWVRSQPTTQARIATISLLATGCHTTPSVCWLLVAEFKMKKVTLLVQKDWPVHSVAAWG